MQREIALRNPLLMQTVNILFPRKKNISLQNVDDESFMLNRKPRQRGLHPGLSAVIPPTNPLTLNPFPANDYYVHIPHVSRERVGEKILENLTQHPLEKLIHSRFLRLSLRPRCFIRKTPSRRFGDIAQTPCKYRRVV